MCFYFKKTEKTALTTAFANKNATKNGRFYAVQHETDLKPHPTISPQSRSISLFRTQIIIDSLTICNYSGQIFSHFPLLYDIDSFPSNLCIFLPFHKYIGRLYNNKRYAREARGEIEKASSDGTKPK